MTRGMVPLLWLIVRRDRLKLPIWLLGVVGSLLLMVPLLANVYGDTDSLMTLYQSFGMNPAGLFLTGPMDAPSLGALMTIETVLWWGMVIAFMNSLLIVRHTRQNEEMGAQELLLSGQTHRATGLASAIIVAASMNLVLAVAIGGGMSYVSHAWSTESAWLYGSAFGLFGMVWASLAAVVVQLVESSRTANGIMAGLVGIAFVLRGVGDFIGTTNSQGLVEPAWLSWLSPLGWLQATRSLTAPNWQPLLWSIVCIIVVTPIAFWLLSRRDVAAGLLPSRAGRSRASMWLQTPLGFTWRLQRTILFGWLVAIIAMVATIGALAPEMSHVYDQSEAMQTMIHAMGGSGAMLPAFLSAMLAIMVLLVVGYAIHGVSRIRHEEAHGYAESVLATGMSRRVWVLLHSGLVVGAAASMLVIIGWLLAVLVNMNTTMVVDVSEYVMASIAYLPVVSLFVGGYLLLFGMVPRLAAAVVWGYFGITVFLEWLAPLLRINETLMHLSPLAFVAAAPAETIEWQPLLLLFVISGLAGWWGLVAWQRRDMTEQ